MIDGRTNLAVVTEKFHELNDSLSNEHLRLCFPAKTSASSRPAT